MHRVPSGAGVLLATLLLAMPAAAQDPAADGAAADTAADSETATEARVVVGGALVPDYFGSDDSDWRPYAEADLIYGNYYAKLRGSRLRANVIDDPNWHAGPFLAYRRDRNDVEDRRIEVMDGIDPAFEVGGFLEYEHSFRPDDPRYAERVRLTVRQDAADAHGGWLATLRGTIQRPILRPLIAAASVGVTWASEDYMNTYFGVSSPDSARSGLAEYEAGAGVRDVNVALALNQFLSRTWSVTGRVAYTRLLGDAADSPVVDDAGTPNQVVVTLGVGYRF